MTNMAAQLARTTRRRKGVRPTPAAAPQGRACRTARYFASLPAGFALSSIPGNVSLEWYNFYTDAVRVRSGEIGRKQREARDRLWRGPGDLERRRSIGDSGSESRRTSLSGDWPNRRENVVCIHH